MHRRAFTVVAALSVAVGTLAGTSFGRPTARAGCPPEHAQRIASGSILARGRGLPAIVGGSIVVLGVGGRRQVFLAPRTPNILIRHVAAQPGVGTAYVEDHPGPDTIVVIDRDGVSRLPQMTEATQPSWSSDGRLIWSTGSGLSLWSRSTGLDMRIPPPTGAVNIFSPLFAGPHRIIAVVSERVPGARLEDDALDDLFRYDLRSRTWSKLTDFRATGDRWFAIRTPVVMPGGALQFVGVSGHASATVKPTPSLWELGDSGPRKVRDLIGERYLAGTLGGRRVWNVFDEEAGDWRLRLEGPSGAVDLGCGRTMVDPRSEANPDRGGFPASPTVSPTRSPVPTATATVTATVTVSITPTASPPSSTPTVTPSGWPTPTAAPFTEPADGILVGDLGSRDAAEAVAHAIGEAYGTDVDVEVIDNTMTPWLIQPGAWAAVMRLSPDEDPISAWEAFRQRLPQYVGMSWVVSL